MWPQRILTIKEMLSPEGVAIRPRPPEYRMHELEEKLRKSRYLRWNDRADILALLSALPDKEAEMTKPRGQTRKVWVVLTKQGEVASGGIGNTRHAAIVRAATTLCRPWDVMKGRGYRVVRATLTWPTPAKGEGR